MSAKPPRRSRHMSRPDSTALVRVAEPATAPVPVSSRSYLPPGATLEDCVTPFLQHLAFVRHRSPNTVKSYAFDLRAFLTFCGRSSLYKPDDVTVIHVEMFLVWLKHHRALKAASVNRHLAAVRTFFAFLVREGAVAKNPGELVSWLKQPERLPEYLTIEEQERLLDALDTGTSPIQRRDYAMVATALFTGLRAEELCSMRLADLRLSGPAAALRVPKSKGSRARELPVVPRLAAILSGYLRYIRPRLLAEGAESPYVFVVQRGGRGKPINTRSLRALFFERISDVAGRRIWPHLFRHSFASRLRENGADLADIQEALGHARLETTMQYAHLSTTKRNERLARLLG